MAALPVETILSDSSEEEELLNDNQLHEQLESCLENIQPFGSFAFLQELPDAPNPGIF